jgi:TrmH family RNA methyltransferase
LHRLIDGKRGGEAVLEGIHLCQEWLRHKGLPRAALFDSEKLASGDELAGLAQALPEPSCISCEPALLRGLSQVGHGQGVYFLVTVPEPELPERITENCLWLDRIQDPGNLGTLLRTACAAGIAHAYLSTGCASAWAPKVLRSAQGAHFAMTVHEHVDLEQLRGQLDVPLLATALEGAVPLYDAALPEHCAWLIGNEGQGVEPALLALADTRVFIPQAPGVESLNAAVAAAICVFEQRRRYIK